MKPWQKLSKTSWGCPVWCSSLGLSVVPKKSSRPIASDSEGCLDMARHMFPWIGWRQNCPDCVLWTWLGICSPGLGEDKAVLIVSFLHQQFAGMLVWAFKRIGFQDCSSRLNRCWNHYWHCKQTVGCGVNCSVCVDQNWHAELVWGFGCFLVHPKWICTHGGTPKWMVYEGKSY